MSDHRPPGAGTTTSPNRSIMPGEDDLLCGPRWRVILEEQWRDPLQEGTEVSVADHRATPETPDGITDKHARRLLRQGGAAPRPLAPTQDPPPPPAGRG